MDANRLHFASEIELREHAVQKVPSATSLSRSLTQKELLEANSQETDCSRPLIFVNTCNHEVHSYRNNEDC